MLTELPSQLRAGETLSFTLSLSDYPANSSWVVTYSLRRLHADGDLIEFTGSASGADHAFSVAASTTVDWIDGEYTGAAVATKSGESHQVWSGRFTILPYVPSPASSSQDPRSQARKTLDNINAVLEGRASSSVLNSEIQGTRIDRIPIKDLLLLRDYYETVVAQELDAENLANGKPSRRNVFVQFARP